MYTKLSISLPEYSGKFISGYEQRQLLIAAFDGNVPDGRLVGRNQDFSLRQGGVAPTLESQAGDQYGSPPDIRFQPGFGALVLYAFGPEASGVLLAAAPDIHAGLIRILGNAKVPEITTAKMGLIPVEQLVTYSVSAIALQRRKTTKQAAAGGRFELKDFKDVVARAIAGGIVSRAIALSETVPGLADQLPYSLEKEIVIMSGNMFLRRPGGEKTPMCLCAGNVQFALPYRLVGAWEAGAFRSYGYGAIAPGVVERNQRRLVAA